MHVVDVTGPVTDAIAAFAADARVESVDRDRTRDAEATPNDPSYADQWALPQIGWDQAYGSVTPAGTATIAVLDTGVDAGDLPLVAGFSAIGGGTGDPNGHGTWMASIAAATTDNNDGIAGVAYDGVSVMPVKVLGADGTGNDSDIITGLVWAADNGADVALMSFSNPGYSQALQDAVDYAWSHGVVVVAAVGNDGVTDTDVSRRRREGRRRRRDRPDRRAVERLQLRRRHVHQRPRCGRSPPTPSAAARSPSPVRPRQPRSWPAPPRC